MLVVYLLSVHLLFVKRNGLPLNCLQLPFVQSCAVQNKIIEKHVRYQYSCINNHIVFINQ